MKKIILTLTALSALFFSCSSDDDPATEVEVPEEVITDVDIVLVAGDETVTLSIDDADGIGLGEASVITGGTLTANTTYTGSITLTNALADDPDEMDVTAEILELDDEHQFFFIPEGDLDLDTEYEDQDDDGYPVGLSFTLTTGDASTGDLRIVLRHEPNKAAEGVSEGDIINETDGESDFDEDFPVTIEEPITQV